MPPTSTRAPRERPSPGSRLGRGGRSPATARRQRMTAQTAAARPWGGHSMVAPLRRVLVYAPAEPSRAVSWRAFGYPRPIDHRRAVEEHAAFRRALAGAGAEVVTREIDDPALQDAIFPF